MRRRRGSPVSDSLCRSATASLAAHVHGAPSLALAQPVEQVTGSAERQHPQNDATVSRREVRRAVRRRIGRVGIRQSRRTGTAGTRWRTCRRPSSRPLRRRRWRATRPAAPSGSTCTTTTATCNTPSWPPTWPGQGAAGACDGWHVTSALHSLSSPCRGSAVAAPLPYWAGPDAAESAQQFAAEQRLACRAEEAASAEAPSVQFPAGNRSFLYSDGMQRRGSRDATYLHRRHPRCCPAADACTPFACCHSSLRLACQPGRQMGAVQIHAVHSGVQSSSCSKTAGLSCCALQHRSPQQDAGRAHPAARHEPPAAQKRPRRPRARAWRTWQRTWKTNLTWTSRTLRCARLPRGAACSLCNPGRRKDARSH